MNDLIIDGVKCKNTEMANECDRINSFIGNFIPIGKSAKLMALNGFYYNGPFDNVRCFFCGVALKNWQLDDDVFEDHKRWFSTCQFIKKNETNIKKYSNINIINACMKSSNVKTLINKGYKESIIRYALEQKLENNYDTFENIDTLLDDVLKIYTISKYHVAQLKAQFNTQPK